MILREDYPVFGAFPKLAGTSAVDEIILVKAKRAAVRDEHTPASIYRDESSQRSAKIPAIAMHQRWIVHLAVSLFLISHRAMHRTMRSP